jgi:hypothetical protein
MVLPEDANGQTIKLVRGRESALLVLPLLTRSLDPFSVDEQLGVHGGLAFVGGVGVALPKVVSERHDR